MIVLSVFYSYTLFKLRNPYLLVFPIYGTLHFICLFVLREGGKCAALLIKKKSLHIVLLFFSFLQMFYGK